MEQETWLLSFCTNNRTNEVLLYCRQGRWAGLGRDGGGGGGSKQSWAERGPRDESIEAELFAGQNSGINFDKYEEIPVEATGEDVPNPISTVSCRFCCVTVD